MRPRIQTASRSRPPTAFNLPPHSVRAQRQVIGYRGSPVEGTRAHCGNNDEFGLGDRYYLNPEVADWCFDHGISARVRSTKSDCGTETAIYIQFKTDADLTFFLLRWKGEFPGYLGGSV